jgi:hypothetical protein
MGSESVQQERAALLGVALAGAIAVVVTEADWDLWSTMIGATLILVLSAYDNRADNLPRERMAFAAVYALCSTLLFGILLDFIALLLFMATGEDCGPFGNTAMFADAKDPCGAFHWRALVGLAGWITVFTILYRRRRTSGNGKAEPTDSSSSAPSTRERGD